MRVSSNFDTHRRLPEWKEEQHIDAGKTWNNIKNHDGFLVFFKLGESQHHTVFLCCSPLYLLGWVRNSIIVQKSKTAKLIMTAVIRDKGSKIFVNCISKSGSIFSQRMSPVIAKTNKRHCDRKNAGPKGVGKSRWRGALRLPSQQIALRPKGLIFSQIPVLQIQADPGHDYISQQPENETFCRYLLDMFPTLSCCL